MCRSLIKSVFGRSLILKTFIFKLERWLREDLYSKMSHQKFTLFLTLLATEASGGILFSRKGSINDGGYVFCDLQKQYSKLISFGVGDNVEFEDSISDLVSSIDLYDPTVDELPHFIDNAIFYKVGLGPELIKGYTTLYDATKIRFPTTSFY